MDKSSLFNPLAPLHPRRKIILRFCLLSTILVLTLLVLSVILISNSTSDSINKSPSFVIPLDKDTLLGGLATTYAVVNHTTRYPISGFYPLSDGQEALLARLALIENAEHSVDIQYYIYRDDQTSSLLTYTLYQAAERGVRVRILLDDMQSRNDKNMAALAAHPNIDLRLFNTFDNRVLRILNFVTDFDRMNRRMHNKALIADNAFAVTGGRNIGNEYFAANHTVDFGDFDLLLTGSAVPSISHQFDLYWNSAPATPIGVLINEALPPSKQHIQRWQASLAQSFKGTDYLANVSALPLMQALKKQTLSLYWGQSKVLYDRPSKVSNPEDTPLMLHALDDVLSKATSSFLLISPYFVPTQAGSESLVKAAKAGINITIITNSLASNDVFAVHGWYAKYRQKLVESGIALYEVKVDPKIKKHYSWLGSSRTSLHAKTFVIDNNEIFAGSFNFDPRSAFLNTEMGVLVESPEFIENALSHLDNNLKKNTYRLTLDGNGDILWHDDLHQTTYHSEPDASIWLRLGAWIAGVLPIEKQL